MTRIGLALYTVRDDTARDLEGTLHAVAEIGYEGVELHRLDGHDPVQVRAWLDDAGLSVSSRHASLDATETDLPALAAEARAIGWRRLVLAWLDPSTLEDPSWPSRLRRAAEAAIAHGLELGYHNHDAEVRHRLPRAPALGAVRRGRPRLGVVGGSRSGGCARPAPRARPARSRQGLPRPGPRTGLVRTVGDGVVGYARVARAAVAAGVDWLLVEQDHCQGPALEAAAGSFAALTRMAGTA